MTGFSKQLTDLLAKNGTIKIEDKELYAFGIQQGIVIVINILTVILIGFVFSMVWQSILFMALYFPLRSFAGGYHAKTHLRCYLISIILTFSVFAAIKYMPWAESVSIVTAITAGIIITVLAPVEDSNKPLDKIEISIYKRRTRAILSVEIFMMFIALILGWRQVVYCIAVSLAVLGVMLILGKIKNAAFSKMNKVRSIKTDQNSQ